MVSTKIIVALKEPRALAGLAAKLPGRLRFILSGL